MTIPKGTIKIEMEGISYQETERYREIIHWLIASGGLNIKNGKTILNFDSEGLIQEITTDATRWRRNKPISKDVAHLKVETTQIPQGVV